MFICQSEKFSSLTKVQDIPHEIQEKATGYHSTIFPPKKIAMERILSTVIANALKSSLTNEEYIYLHQVENFLL